MDLRASVGEVVDAGEQLRSLGWTLALEGQHAEAVEAVERLGGGDLWSDLWSYTRSQPLGRLVGPGVDQPDEGLCAGFGQERRGQALPGRGALQGFDLAHRLVRLRRRESHRQVLAALGEELSRLSVTEPDRRLASLQEVAGRHRRRETGGSPGGPGEAGELQHPGEEESARQIEGKRPRRSEVGLLQVEPEAGAIDLRKSHPARLRLPVEASVDALLEVTVGEAAGEGGRRRSAHYPGREVVAQESSLRGRVSRP